MNAIELLPFQRKASDTIVERYNRLVTAERRPMVYAGWPVPFYQALSGLTGAGKTPILADAVAQIRAGMPGEPIVFWMSMAKAVVDQTATNFAGGGKYTHLIEGFLPFPIGDLTQEAIRDGSVPVIVLATVGTFN